MSFGLYFLTLILTLLIEIGIAYIFGYRRKQELKIFILVNFVTHPLLSYFLWLNSVLLVIPINYFIIFILEMIVVILEMGLLRLGLGFKYLDILKVSIFMNLGSFLFGLIIF